MSGKIDYDDIKNIFDDMYFGDDYKEFNGKINKAVINFIDIGPNKFFDDIDKISKTDNFIDNCNDYLKLEVKKILYLANNNIKNDVYNNIMHKCSIRTYIIMTAILYYYKHEIIVKLLKYDPEKIYERHELYEHYFLTYVNSINTGTDGNNIFIKIQYYYANIAINDLLVDHQQIDPPEYKDFISTHSYTPYIFPPPPDTTHSYTPYTPPPNTTYTPFVDPNPDSNPPLDKKGDKENQIINQPSDEEEEEKEEKEKEKKEEKKSTIKSKYILLAITLLIIIFLMFKLKNKRKNRSVKKEFNFEM